MGTRTPASRRLGAATVAVLLAVGILITMSRPARADVRTPTVSIAFSGAIVYANSGAVVENTLRTTDGSFGGFDVAGRVVLPGLDGGVATLRVDIRALLGLPLYFGTVAVSDPSVGLNVTTPHLFSGIHRGEDGSLAASESWFAFDPFPAGYTLRWSTGSEDATAANPVLAALTEYEADYCRDGQHRMAGLDPAEIIVDDIGSTLHATKVAFEDSKPVLDPLAVQTYLEQGIGARADGSPLQLTHRIYCKTKTVDHIATRGDLSTADRDGQCKLLNQRSLDLAWAALTPDQQAAFEAEGTPIVLGDDIVWQQGNQWLAPFDELRDWPDTPGAKELRANALLVRWTDPAFALFPESFRGQHYCTTWSPAWAYSWFTALGMPDDGTVPPRTSVLPPLPSETATASVGGDPADVYYPAAGTDLPVVLLLQGGLVDKGHYSFYAASVASDGFVVVVPNHSRSLFGQYGFYPEVTQVDAVLAWAQAENAAAGSPLQGRLDPATLGLLGHSFGGATGLMAMGGGCELPFCDGTFAVPDALQAAVFYEASTANPLGGGVAPTENDGRAIAILHGTLDETARAEALASLDGVATPPKAFLDVAGANHFSIANVNNPPGAAADSHYPTIGRLLGITTIADWSALFLRAHLLGDATAAAHIYDGIETDPNVDVVVAQP